MGLQIESHDLILHPLFISKRCAKREFGSNFP